MGSRTSSPGLIGRVDLRTGSMDLVNAGHVAPYLARGAHVTALDLPVDLPLGLFRDTPLPHQPARPGAGRPARLRHRRHARAQRRRRRPPEAIVETRSLHPREAVRALADRVLDATGNALSDDATVLCLDWHGGHGRDRDSVHGAEQGRASERDRRPPG